MRLSPCGVFLRASVLFSLLAGSSIGCGGGAHEPPFVALANPSFEVLGANPDGGQPESWIREGTNDWSLSGLGVQRKTGVGFMPSDGQYFLEFPASDAGAQLFPGHFPDLVAYQDNVNLSRATNLVFDYEVTNRAIFAGSAAPGYDGAASVRIFFQPNAGGGAMVVLWSRIYGPETAGEQVSGVSAPLPSLPVPGRLTIEVTADPSLSGSLVTLSKLTFRIDHLRAL
jgi:hypothetical protein